MKPKTVIGIDPGGNGTTGIVVCSEWKIDGAWWIPGLIEAYSVKGWYKSVERFTELKSEHADISVACEDVAVWDVRGDDVLSTCRQIGAFEYANLELLEDPFARILPTVYRSWWLGGAVPKGKADGAIDQALLQAYGGKDLAVGGKKCPTCKGKGRVGRHLRMRTAQLTEGVIRHTPEGGEIVWHHKWYRLCPDCNGAKESPRGQLYPLWKPRSLQHCRAALAVAVYAYNNDVWKEKG